MLGGADNQMVNYRLISLALTAGSCMSAESLLMCCGELEWSSRQMTMSCRKSPDLRG